MPLFVRGCLQTVATVYNQATPEEFNEQTIALLASIAAMDPTWSVNGIPDRLHALQDRGTALAALSTSFVFLNDQVTRLQNAHTLPIALSDLPEQLGIGQTLLQNALRSYQVQYDDFIAQPWAALSDASLQHLFSRETNDTSSSKLGLSVAGVHGPTVMLAFQTPQDDFTVELQGGARLLGQQFLSGSGAIPQFASTTVTIDAAQRSGIYAAILRDAKTGSIFNTVALQWDHDSKTFTVPSAFVFSASTTLRDTGLLPYDELINASLKEEAMQTTQVNDALTHQSLMDRIGGSTITNGQLDTPQSKAMVSSQHHVFVALAFDLSPAFHFQIIDNDFQNHFYAALPQWKEENRQQTMKDMRLGWRDFDYYRSAEITGYGKGVYGFNEHIDDMMGVAVDAILMLKRGDDATQLLQRLDSLSHEQPDSRLQQIGFNYPDSTKMLRAANDVLEFDAATIIDNQTQQQADVDAMVWYFNNGSVGGTGAASSPTQGLSLDEARRIVVAQSKVLGAAQIRGENSATIASYTKGVVAAQGNYNTVARGGVVLSAREQDAAAIVKAAHDAQSVLTMFATDGVTPIGKGGVLFAGVKAAGTSVAGLLEALESGGGTLATEAAPGVLALLDHSGIVGTVPAEAETAATTVAGRLKRQLYEEALQWLMPADQSAATLIFSIEGQPIVRIDTVAGRLIAGAAKSLWTTQEVTSQWTTAFMIQVLTDIPAQRFMTARQESHTPTAFADAIHSLMVDAQYGHLITSSVLSQTAIVMVAPNRPTYTDPTQPIRLRFDLPVNMQHTRSINVYNGKTLLAQTTAGTFINIPPSTFNASGTYALTLSVATNDGQAKLIQVPSITIAFTRAPKVQNAILHFSTNTNQQQSRLEDAVLTVLHDHFYLDNPASLNWLIASSAHHDSAFNAVDILVADKTPVYAPFNGTVVRNQLDGNSTSLDADRNPTLILEHRMTVDGNDVFWYTKYLHMYYDPANGGQVGIRDSQTGAVTPLPVGTTVNTHDQIGNAGNFGHSTGPHVHEETFMATDGKQITDPANFFSPQSPADIDQRLLLTNAANDATPGFGIKAKAIAVQSNLANGPKLDVEWNGVLNSWVNVASYLVYNRTQQQPGVEENDSYWMAWEASRNFGDMVKVTYENISTSNAENIRWITSTPPEIGKDVWNPKTRMWVTRAESLL